MRTVSRPWTAEGVTALGFVAVALLELLAWNLAPQRDRLLLGVALAVVALAAWAVSAAYRRGHQRRDLARHAVVRPATAPGEQWFTADTLEGFPTEAVRPLLDGAGGPDANRMYTAWVFAAHGYDTAWIAHHLDLPTTVVQPLVDAAARRRARRHGTDAVN